MFPAQPVRYRKQTCFPTTSQLLLATTHAVAMAPGRKLRVRSKEAVHDADDGGEVVEHAPPNMPSEKIVPSTMLSEVEARQYIHNNTLLEPHVTLPEGWVTNIVNVPVAPGLSWQDCRDYIALCRSAMSWEERLDPKYYASALYWDRAVDTEYEAHCGSFFLPAGMREPPAEWFESDNNDGTQVVDPLLPTAPAIAGESSMAAPRAPEMFIVDGRTLHRGGCRVSEE